MVGERGDRGEEDGGTSGGVGGAGGGGGGAGGFNTAVTCESWCWAGRVWTWTKTSDVRKMSIMTEGKSTELSLKLINEVENICTQSQ